MRFDKSQSNEVVDVDWKERMREKYFGCNKQMCLLVWNCWSAGNCWCQKEGSLLVQSVHSTCTYEYCGTFSGLWRGSHSTMQRILLPLLSTLSLYSLSYYGHFNDSLSSDFDQTTIFGTLQRRWNKNAGSTKHLRLPLPARLPGYTARKELQRVSEDTC